MKCPPSQFQQHPFRNRKLGQKLDFDPIIKEWGDYWKAVICEYELYISYHSGFKFTVRDFGRRRLYNKAKVFTVDMKKSSCNSSNHIWSKMPEIN